VNKVREARSTHNRWEKHETLVKNLEQKRPSRRPWRGRIFLKFVKKEQDVSFHDTTALQTALSSKSRRNNHSTSAAEETSDWRPAYRLKEISAYLTWSVLLYEWFLIAFAVKWLLASSCLSVRPCAWNNSAPTGRNLTNFDICAFFEYLSRKFKFISNLTRISGTLHLR
jgi:hypothetical protein